MKLEKMHYLGIGIGLVMAIAVFIIFRTADQRQMLYFLLSVALFIGSLPFMISMVLGQGQKQEKEEKFLAFSRDLVETVRSGTPISRSIIQLRSRNYGTLTPHVEKLANQLAIGLTLSDGLGTFSKDINSKVISRAVGLIVEAEKAGGKIDTVLESVAESVNQISTLRKERKASVSNLVTQGYIIFIVFIVIMLVLEFKILPLVSGLEPTEGLKVSTSTVDANELSMPLFVMLLVQSFFAGLVIGKISEGTISSGFRHSFILLTITLLVTTGAKALF